MTETLTQDVDFHRGILSNLHRDIEQQQTNLEAIQTEKAELANVVKQMDSPFPSSTTPLVLSQRCRAWEIRRKRVERDRSTDCSTAAEKVGKSQNRKLDIVGRSSLNVRPASERLRDALSSIPSPYDDM